MKVAITYPPLESDKGVPLLGQNRQFQWFNSPTYIYPMVPASAATLLQSRGYEAVWDDAIAEEKTWAQYETSYAEGRYDLVLLETKAPVVRRHWEIIRRLKELCPGTLVAVAGDHVTAFPAETMGNCPCDYVLTGGDYDFLLLNLCEHLTKGAALEPGVWYREGGAVKDTGPFTLCHDLNELPMIDRDLTKWRLYSEKNGNYSRLPGTYTMAARDCWHHKCTFCSWTTLYPTFRARSPEKLLDEVGVLIERYGVREIMDDSGAFPTGEWLRAFCRGMIGRGYHKRVVMDCNMRFCALSYDDYRLMRSAGFRFVLFGLESANQATLDRIGKGERIGEMVESCRLARKAGLSPHITIMFGYPWEGEEDIQRTVELGRTMLKKGWARTLQATVLIPYPGTPLYRECRENGWLLTEDYDDFDQRMPVMRTDVGEARIREAVQSVYRVAFSPEFIARRLADIRSWDDVRFLFRAAGKVFGHLTDFGK